MDDVNVLENIMAKTAKNTSIENRKVAVEALRKLYSESQDAKIIAEYLIKLHYSVCQSFFEEVVADMGDDDVLAIVEALIDNEQFKKGKPNNIMYPKGFVAVLALAQKKKYQAAFLILNDILWQSEKPEGFPDGCKNNFNKLVVEKSGLSAIQNIINQISDGIVKCKDVEKRKLIRFLDSVVGNVVSVVEVNKEPPSFEDNDSEPKSQAQHPQLPPMPDSFKLDSVEISTKRLEKTQQEILATLRRLAENHASIDSLTGLLQKKDAELSSARNEISNKENQLMALGFELRTRDKRIEEADEKIADLTDRLRTSLQMDDISKSQELITLKNDISEALKLDYADFMKSKENVYSQDLFEAYRSTLTRIFKLLKRFGINCQ
jgi:hypothetical protein